MEACLSGRDPDDLFAFSVPRTLKIRNRKLGILRLLLGVALLVYIAFQIFSGITLMEKVQVSEWGSGSIAVAPDYEQDQEWKPPANDSLTLGCAPVSRDVLAPIEKRHVERLSEWVNNNGYVQLTEPYMRDWCENHQLAHLQYGSKVVGVMASEGVARMLSSLEKGGLGQDKYVAWVEEETTDKSGFHLGSWWSYTGFGAMSLGKLQGGSGTTEMLLQTGQTLKCQIAGNNITVVTLKNTTVTGVLEGHRIQWTPTDPMLIPGRVWEHLPPLAGKTLTKDEILQQAHSVKALGINGWSPTALKTIADGAADGSFFTVVFDTVHALPCLTRHAQRLLRAQSPHDLLLVSKEEHFLHAKDFVPSQLADSHAIQEQHLFVGGTMHENAASAAIQLGFTAINKNAVKALDSGTIASCSIKTDSCETERQQNVTERTWEGFQQKSVIIKVSDLLLMKNMNLHKCSSSDACTLLLVVRFSNELDRFDPVFAFKKMAAPLTTRFGWGEEVPESGSEWGRIKFRVEVYRTVSSGTIQDYASVRSLQKDCTHERKHLGVRLQMRVTGTLYRWNAMNALQALGSLNGLVGVVNSVVTMCAIGYLGSRYVGPVSTLYKAMSVKHTPDASTMDDKLKDKYGDVAKGIQKVALGEISRQMQIGGMQMERSDNEAALLLDMDGAKGEEHLPALLNGGQFSDKHEI